MAVKSDKADSLRGNAVLSLSVSDRDADLEGVDVAETILNVAVDDESIAAR